MSELLHRLRRELDVLVDPVARAEVIARIAGVHARSGHFNEARKAIDAIKEQFSRGESGRVTVWKMIAEGLVLHYENLSPAALERISGALALGQAMHYSTAIALASAWKSHIEFERSNFAKMAESLTVALQNVGPTEHDAQTRVAMVLANAFMVCGDHGQMQAWFMRGRAHALKNGDRASVEALQYNKAAFATAWARVCGCVAPIDAEELRVLRGEVNSARNLQELAGISALSSHVQLVHARLLILEAKYESAIEALSRVRTAEPFARHNFHQSYIDLELQYCSVKLGAADFSMVSRYEDVLQQFVGLDIDERVVACWMLAEIAQSAGLSEERSVCRTEAHSLLAEHAEACKSLRASLESLAHGLHDNCEPNDTLPTRQ